MKLSYKLILGYLLVAMLGSVTTYFALRSYQNINGSVEHLMSEPVAMIKSLEGIRAAGGHIISSTSEISFILSRSDKPEENSLVEEEHQLVHSGIEKYQESLKDYEQLIEADKTVDVKFLEAIRKDGDALIQSSEQIIALNEKGITGEEILEKKEIFEEGEIAFFHSVDNALSHEYQELADAQGNVGATIAQATLNTLLVTLFTFILAIISGLYISRRISNRITKLKNASEDVGRGDLETIIEIGAHDEIGALTRSFNKMVGDLKNSRADLAVAARRESLMLEYSLDVICSVDAEGKFASVSMASLKVLGYQPEELIGRRYIELVTPEDIVKTNEVALEITSGIKTTNFENRYIHKNGSLIDVMWSAVWSETDQLMFCVGHDITERKKSENALRQNEEKYRELIENANDVIYTLDVSGTKYTSLNKAGERITGYTRAEAVHLGIADVVSEADLERMLEQTAKKLSGQGQTNFELEIIAKDGSLVMLDISSRLIYQDGVVAGIQGIGRDITERKRAEMERQAITEVVESVITTSNLDELFTLAYKAINRCLSAENCYIALYDPATELLHYEFWEDKVRPVPASHPIEKSFGGYVLKSRQPVLLNKEFEEQMYESGRVEPSNGYSPSWMGVPLRIGTKTIGILVVQDYEKRDVYSARDLQMLSAVGDQLALAIAHKRNEIDLKASEAQHRLLFESNPQPAFVYDLETLAFLTVNKAAVEHYGYSREEFLTGITVKDIRPIEDIPGFLERVSKVRPEGETINAHSRHQKKNGTVIDVEITSSPLIYSGRHAEIVLANDVTERKRTEKEQARLTAEIGSQRRRLNNIVSTVPGVVWEAWGEPDAATQKIDFISVQVKQMLGYSVEEWISTPNFWLTIVHPDDSERAARIAAEGFASGEPTTQQFRWVSKLGRVIWVEANFVVVKDDEGRSIGLRGVTMDITERKRAEDELKESKEWLAAVFEASQDGIIVEESEKIVFMNDRLLKMHGYNNPEEIIGKHISELLTPEDSERMLEYSRKRLRGEEVPTIYEFKGLGDDAGKRDFEASISTFTSNGKFYIVTVQKDITERKELEHTLQASEESYRAFIEKSSEGIWRFDFDQPLPTNLSVDEQISHAVTHGYLAECNNAMARMYGFDSADDLRNTRLSNFFVLSDEANYEYFSGFINSNYCLNDAESHEITKSGEDKFFLNNLIGIFENGDLVSAWGTQRDITERKQAEEQLKIYNEKLQQSNRELQDFAYVASHDLQEPLRKVQAFADRLNSKYAKALTGEGLDYLERMRSAANRMQTLIQDLLTFSRVTTKGQPFLAVNLETVTREVLSDLEISIEQAGAKIEMDNLPEIDADPMQMRQLIQNLIGNAVKFRRKEIAPIIKISARSVKSNSNGNGNGSNGNLCQLRVEDNGIGFDEKYLDRIFTVFQRLHGRSEYEGSGVGLAVCRKIAERHHGSITAESSVDKGTVFIVTLPYKQPKTELN